MSRSVDGAQDPRAQSGPATGGLPRDTGQGQPHEVVSSSAAQAGGAGRARRRRRSGVSGGRGAPGTRADCRGPEEEAMSEVGPYPPYSMILEWDSRGGIFVVTVPELPGCRTHGRTYEEAVRQGQDAIATWLTGEPRATWPLPRDFTARE